jgi:hypothetical protein
MSFNWDVFFILGLGRGVTFQKIYIFTQLVKEKRKVVIKWWLNEISFLGFIFGPSK